MKKNLFSYKTNLVSGLLITTPILVSFALFAWAFDKLTGFIPQLFATSANPMFNDLSESMMFMASLRIIAIFLYLMTLYTIGLMTNNILGKKLLALWDKIIDRIPLLNVVYSTLQQLVTAIWGDKSAGMFKEVVLVEYPKEKMYVIGFITDDASHSVKSATGFNDMKSIFIPTTPNPTSGFLIFLPQSDILKLDMSVTEGMQLVISGGTVKPNQLEPTKEVTVEQLESQTEPPIDP